MSEGLPSGGNNHPPQSEEPKVLIKIIGKEDGSAEMQSSLPPDQVILMFEKMKFRLLNGQVNSMNSKNSIIHPPKGGIMNFVRGGMKK